MTRRFKPLCPRCGDVFAAARRRAGYLLCLPCGEEAAREERTHWTVVQEYGKGGYMFVTANAAPTTLKQTNQKEIRT
jgi:tRNA(Ile2) C34 agmatinyltransferase TiaS